jgi:non-specific serine/threonine protein kinase/serine/threonine-protein kinase
MNELDLFAAAIAITDPTERAKLLDRECAGRPDLRQRLDRLLEAHAHSNPLLDAPNDATAAHVSAQSLVGAVIAGRYKLLEAIGEGGMGTVFVAEQTEPVKRKVALKLIKPGMDSKSVLARFEVERQALAMMDHPNIAKVLDGGITDQGRPFFVMEYVKGVPITDYCDATRLSVTGRLNLFVQVCHAVQHAHQKGIIHRDLKPSNILVAPYDDKPVPKIIDFGLAKAMHQSLTERTLHTAHESVLGTPLYMSPEQAQLNNLDIDTRSDIYSLGVLLYELLTGTTPVERKRFKVAAWDEMRRIIREEEPPRPSTRLTSTATLPSLAAGRQTEPTRLTKMVRGELDWIVMKSLEKDRTRRYETANGFAMDVGRFLSGEPVLAVPPSASYRLRKFVRKHRAALSVAASVLVLVLAGIAGTTLGMIRATRAAEAERLARADAQAREAETAAVVQFMEEKLVAAANPAGESGGLGHDVSLRAALDSCLPYLAASFQDQPLIEAQLRKSLGKLFNSVGEFGKAREQLERSRALFTQHRGPEHLDTLKSMHNLANSYAALNRQSEALKLREEVLEICKRVLPKDHPVTLASMDSLAISYAALNRQPEALKLFEEVVEIQKRVLPKDHPDTLMSMNNLAVSYSALKRQPEALKLREEVLEIQKRVLPKDHPDTLKSMGNLASSYYALNRQPEALKILEEVLEIQKRVLPRDHPDTLMSMCNLAVSYGALYRLAEALPLAEEVLRHADEPGFPQRLFSPAVAVLIRCHRKAGDLARCRATTEMLVKRNLTDAESLYNAACYQAVTASLQAKATDPHAAKLAKDDGDKAMAWLQKAVAAGWKDAAHMKTDTDLDILRDRDDFKKLMAELEAKSPTAEKK